MSEAFKEEFWKIISHIASAEEHIEDIIGEVEETDRKDLRLICDELRDLRQRLIQKYRGIVFE